MRALQTIYQDNLRLRNDQTQPRKPSTYDPAQLVWTPRKRHNTRWPVNPPEESCEFIAELQPLIRFELHRSQIEEAQDLARPDDKQQSSLRKATPEERVQNGHKDNRGNRRRTLRPSLGTIMEADDENPSASALTPSAKSRPNYSSPVKSSNTNRYRTPRKVAESPLKVFSISAGLSGNGNEVQVNKPSIDAKRPSLPNEDEESATEPNDADLDYEGRSPTSKNLPLETAPEDSEALTSGEGSALDTYLAALPFFDAPIPVSGAYVEPAPETKRRISLDNIRRTDRRSDAKIIKRVSQWMERTSAKKAKGRRHSELPHDLLLGHEKTHQKRRHTLDVDVGRTLDIFGQQADTLTIHDEPSAEGPAAATTPSAGDTGCNTGDLKNSKPLLVSTTDVAHEPDVEAIKNTDNVAAAADRTTTDVAAETVSKNSTISEDDKLETENEHAGTTASRGNDHYSGDEDNNEGDSALADLHNFVRRAKSSKERKDIPASATILPATTANLTKKRRSGSLGPATSDNGSPMGKTEKVAMTTTTTTTVTSPRVPLGQKDANKSPSPSKKRKLKGQNLQDATAPLTKKVGGRLVAPDFEDYGSEVPTQPKKRRRKMESDSSGDIFNPDMFPSQDLTKRSSNTSEGASEKDAGTASRRSSRIATVQKTAAIPVRLPGCSPIDLGDMPVPSTAAVTARKAERDLAAQTRTNTDKNKAGAMPVAFVLASLGTAVEDEDDQLTTTVTLSKNSKAVRWDETLVRVQGEATPTLAPAERVEDAAVEEEEDMALPPPPQLRFADDTTDQPKRHAVGARSTGVEEGESEKDDALVKRAAAPVRRSARSSTSRLPTRGGSMTPVKKKAVVQSPAAGLAAKSSAVSAAGARARLGMAGPGTPGPRRGGRRR